MGKYRCQRPIHPGELLKEEIEFRGMKQSDLASRMEISYKMLNDILNCRRSLTPATAMLFEAALGVSAELLMGMQMDYSLRETANEPSFAARIRKIRQYVAAL